MPELPEVETTVRGIHTHLNNLRIEDVWTDYNSPFHSGNSNIKNPKFFQKFRKTVRNKKILGATRRAKNILIHLEGDLTILVHMKMTGHLLYGKYAKTRVANKEVWVAQEDGPLKDPFNQFIHFVMILSNGYHLALSDMRKFAKVTLIPSNEIDIASELSHLGPEPLDSNFSRELLKERLFSKKNGKIKQVLMDQRVISGIGNIYSDEILWSTGIHPQKIVSTLSTKEISLLFTAIQKILSQGIDFKGDSMSDYRTIDGTPGAFQHHHNAYRKTGTACKKKGCKGIIQRIIIGGRSAHFCDTHQK